MRRKYCEERASFLLCFVGSSCSFDVRSCATRAHPEFSAAIQNVVCDGGTVFPGLTRLTALQKSARSASMAMRPLLVIRPFDDDASTRPLPVVALPPSSSFHLGRRLPFLFLRGQVTSFEPLSPMINSRRSMSWDSAVRHLWIKLKILRSHTFAVLWCETLWFPLLQ